METTLETEKEAAHETNQEQIKNEQNTAPKDKSKWTRALLMVLFLIVFGLVEAILWLVTIVGFIAVIVNDRSPQQLVQFGDKLASYSKSIIRFLSYNTDTKPWPFDS